MKALVTIALIATTAMVLAAIAGCGGSANPGSTTATAGARKPAGGLAMQTAGVKTPPKEVSYPDGPPPKHLVVKDLKEGFGATAHRGERITIRYVGVGYETGKAFEVRWRQPFSFDLGAGEVLKGWELGLVGMRVGGRRELIFPSSLGYHNGAALVYVFELLKIERHWR